VQNLEEPHHGQHDLYRSQLPAYLLKDIGLNEADRYQETTKPFWRG